MKFLILVSIVIFVTGALGKPLSSNDDEELMQLQSEIGDLKSTLQSFTEAEDFQGIKSLTGTTSIRDEIKEAFNKIISFLGISSPVLYSLTKRSAEETGALEEFLGFPPIEEKTTEKPAEILSLEKLLDPLGIIKSTIDVKLNVAKGIADTAEAFGEKLQSITNIILGWLGFPNLFPEIPSIELPPLIPPVLPIIPELPEIELPTIPPMDPSLVPTIPELPNIEIPTIPPLDPSFFPTIPSLNIPTEGPSLIPEEPPTILNFDMPTLLSPLPTLFPLMQLPSLISSLPTNDPTMKSSELPSESRVAISSISSSDPVGAITNGDSQISPLVSPALVSTKNSIKTLVDDIQLNFENAADEILDKTWTKSDGIPSLLISDPANSNLFSNLQPEIATGVDEDEESNSIDSVGTIKEEAGNQVNLSVNTLFKSLGTAMDSISKIITAALEPKM